MASNLKIILLALMMSFTLPPTTQAAEPCDREIELLAEVNRLAEAELDAGFQRHFAEQELDEAKRKLDQSPAARRAGSGGYSCGPPTSSSQQGRLYELFGDRPELFGKLLCALRMDRTEVACIEISDRDLRKACTLMADYVDRGDRDADLPIWVMDQLADRSFEQGDAASGLAALLLGNAMESTRYEWCVNRVEDDYRAEYHAWSQGQTHRGDPEKLVELCSERRRELQQAAREHARLKERHERIVNDLNQARREHRRVRNGNEQRGVRCR